MYRTGVRVSIGFSEGGSGGYLSKAVAERRLQSRDGRATVDGTTSVREFLR